MKRILLSLSLAIAAAAVQAQTTDQPLTLVVLPAGDRHLGFILNRATEVKLATLFPRHAPSAKVVDPVHFGGPEMADALFAVVRRDPGADALPLFGGVYLVASAEAVDRVIEQSPGDARFFAGFVGWQPGELAKEIEAGYWYVCDPDSALFFRPDTKNLWQELIERLRFQSAGLRPGPA